MKALLDVNVLIALIDENHPDTVKAERWFQNNIEQGWATCPLTENGCIRILSLPRYPNTLSIQDAVTRLRSVKDRPHYEFIADDISMFHESSVDIHLLSGHRQLTDVYLLALAVEHEMSLVTLDTRIRLETVVGASQSNLVVI